MRLLTLCTLTAGMMWAQTPFPIGSPIFSPYATMQKYLELSDSQVASLNSLRDGFLQFQSEKQERSYQVSGEIAIETAKNPIDPAALGVRYVEIEGIRRQIEERKKQFTADSQAMLNTAQKAKLKNLEDARALQATYQNADCLGLLGPPAAILVAIPSLFAPSAPVISPRLQTGCVYSATKAGIIRIFDPAQGLTAAPVPNPARMPATFAPAPH